MMSHKYSNVNWADPQKSAEKLGDVEKTNYLAHTIREMELAIHLTHGCHYHIVTYMSSERCAKIHFCVWGCLVRLPESLTKDKEDGDRRVRLVLAHELGHLAYNIPNIKNKELLNKNRPIPPEEEIYAWSFAYALIDKKSDDHRDDKRRDRFVYAPGELKASLDSILGELINTEKNKDPKKQKQNNKDSIMKKINEIIASKKVGNVK